MHHMIMVPHSCFEDIMFTEKILCRQFYPRCNPNKGTKELKWERCRDSVIKQLRLYRRMPGQQPMHMGRLSK